MGTIRLFHVNAKGRTRGVQQCTGVGMNRGMTRSFERQEGYGADQTKIGSEVIIARSDRCANRLSLFVTVK